MKTTSSIASCLAALALSSAPLQSAIYNDSVGDVFTGAGGGILDIVSVEVNNDLTDIFFTINLNGPIANPNDWGNYMVGIDSAAGGDSSTPVGNPWNRPIAMSGGMNYWFGSWVDGGGGRQLWEYDGGWSMINSAGVTLGAQSLTFSATLADLGLSIGSTFNFDVYASGSSGDPGAIDSLANPNQTVGDWGDPYVSSMVVQYTVIPEPTTAVLLGFGALLVVRRFIGRRS
jgi:hypothetical protein